MRCPILTVALIVILAAPSAAQSRSVYDGKPESFWQSLEAQITQSLEENVDGMATQQLRNVVIFRSLYADRVSMQGAAPAIIAIHRASSDSEMQALAVAALQSINSMEARSYIRRRVSKSAVDDARLATREILVDALANFAFADID